MEITFKELVEAVNGEILVKNDNTNFNEVCIDTRKITKENIFIALNGENFNGNKYALEALKKGASIVIIDELCEELKEFEGLGIVIKVKNTYDALLDLANFYRNKLNIKIIGVTGSTGKTSTKDLMAAFLSEKYKVFKTKGNFNNEVGMPLMIFSLDSSYDVAVLELGMSDLGEIHKLAKCCRPDIGLITNIGVSHLENLKTRDNILKAKLEITDFFDENNVLIVNGEDDYLPILKSNSYKLLKTGYNKEFDFIGENINLGEETTSFTLVHNGEVKEFTLPMVGKHNVLNALIAIAAAKELNVSYDEMVKGLNNMEATSMRLQFINEDGYRLINDCYNASPDSMKAALDVLKSSKGKRKIAILGDMNELGDQTEKAHEEIGEYAISRADLLLVTGSEKNNYKKGYKSNNILMFENKEALIKFMKENVLQGDVILVKASRGVKFEEIVNELKGINI